VDAVHSGAIPGTLVKLVIWELWVSLWAMGVAPALEGLSRRFNIGSNRKLRPGWEPGLPGLTILTPRGGNYVRSYGPYNGSNGSNSSNGSPPGLCVEVLSFILPTTWCHIMWSITAAPPVAPALHKLVRNIKLLEIQLGCQAKLIHVPGKLMIVQGTNGLTRGMWISPDCLLCSSMEESRLTLEPAPFTPVFGAWALHEVGLSGTAPYLHHTDKTNWTWASIGFQNHHLDFVPRGGPPSTSPFLGLLGGECDRDR
jgi:hypothetical protein